jgi:putative SOS response-associated peptidase YedK
LPGEGLREPTTKIYVSKSDDLGGFGAKTFGSNTKRTVATVKANWWCQWGNAMELEAKFPAFNIRVDSMDQRKMWPPLLRQGKRCIFPIDAFYEWPVKGRGIPPVKIMLADRQPYAIAGLWSRWFDNGAARFSFATFTVESNDFMLPIHPQAMPVILDNIDAQKEWLLNGNRDLLVLYKGEMIADQMPDTLEKLYPEENPPAKQKAKPEPVVEEKEEEEEAQGSLFS